MDEHSSFNVVFDCGVKPVTIQSKLVVRRAFSRNDNIDILFISHLDDDHISLVKTLKETVGCIRRVVLPLINEQDAELLHSLAMATGNIDSAHFWRSLVAAFNGDITGEEEPRFIFISPEEGEIGQSRGRTEMGISGHPIDSLKTDSTKPEWVYIPFCRHSERKSELEVILLGLLEDDVFMDEVCKTLLVNCNSIDDLKRLLLSGAFADLVDNLFIKRKLQKAYTGIAGTINENSLLVYSGPFSKCQDYYLHVPPYSFYRFFPCRHCDIKSRLVYCRVACLFTGDSDLDMGFYKYVLVDKWENVGTIQLPHHGSLKSFCYSNNREEFDKRYLFPVSFGRDNSYGHPSGRALSYLIDHRCLPILVNENPRSSFEQFIYL